MIWEAWRPFIFISRGVALACSLYFCVRVLAYLVLCHLNCKPVLHASLQDCLATTASFRGGHELRFAPTEEMPKDFNYARTCLLQFSPRVSTEHPTPHEEHNLRGVVCPVPRPIPKLRPFGQIDRRGVHLKIHKPEHWDWTMPGHRGREKTKS